MQLIIINCTIEEAKRYAMPQSEYTASATVITASLCRDNDRRPASRRQGMISKLGSIVSSCFSSCVVFGKIFESVPSIGVTASPGRFTTNDSDRIATRTLKAIGVFPVFTFMTVSIKLIYAL